MAQQAPSNANTIIEEHLDSHLGDLESALSADVICYCGPIVYGAESLIRDGIEARNGRRKAKRPKIGFVLETGGGYIEVAQRIADVLRRHYQRVEFIVPDRAMSAGTVLAMSGDAIHMDYFSVLGPIDPQVPRESGGYASAVGYLSKFEELMDKANKDGLCEAETTYLLGKFDPAELYDYEQAMELSISLLEEWLVRYKFKDWKVTETRKLPVTTAMKKQRAKEIGRELSNPAVWHSPGRGISMDVLRKRLKLRIDDLGENEDVNAKLRNYYRLFKDYMSRLGSRTAFHTQKKFVPI